MTDGTEPWIAPILHTVGLHNPATPPTFNPKTGELFTFARSAMTYYLRGVRRYNVLGRINRETGRFDFHWPSEDDGQSWYAFPMIGGENYISPPHLSRAVFAALAEGVGEPAQDLAAKLDRPWCKADLYYVEKLSCLLGKLDVAP